MNSAELREKFSGHRIIVEELFRKGLADVSPEKAIPECLKLEEDQIRISGRSYALNPQRRVWVFGSGKAAGQMARVTEHILGKRIYDGIVIGPYGSSTDTDRIQQFEAAHPVPDLNSLTATYELEKVASDVRETDLVIYLMSGGTSSLLCMPYEDLEFDEIRILYRKLLGCGAPIRDVNKIRKSFSRLKGGGLREVFGHASVEMLAISDVPGNNPADIGSGPLIYEDVSAGEALALMKKYRLDKTVPRSLPRYLEIQMQREKEEASDRGLHSDRRERLGNGRKENLQDDIKDNQENDIRDNQESDRTDGLENDQKRRTDSGEESDKSLHRFPVHTTIVASIEKLASAIRQKALDEGLSVYLHDDFITGEARKIARVIAAQAVEVLARDHPVSKPAALIYYGESTVTVTGKGKGGRNQEMALSAAIAIEGQHAITFFSAGTDGKDGETHAAGALCDSLSALDARKAGIAPEFYLENNDSWNFFRQTRGWFVTGATGTNLMDIQIVLVE